MGRHQLQMTTVPLLEPSDAVTGYEDREYQTQGTNFLRVMRRAFLTDDPGLGKTPQAIRAAELPCMVVAPKYLCEQWVDAIRREHPDAVIAHADGTRTQRDTIISKKADWYVLNLEMPKSYDMPTGIRTYINDESHHHRNRNADRTKAVYVMETDDLNARVYNLTATPFWKSVDDIWMQVQILRPGVLPPYNRFVKLYCISLRGAYGPKVIGVKKAMRAGLRELLQPIMLGRTYKDVGRYLPEIIESIIKINLPATHMAIYDKLVRDFSFRWGDEEEQRKIIFNPATVLHALRQITAQSGKFETVESIIEDNNDKPAVIGFWYKDHARMMQARLGDSKSVLVTGDLDATERHRRALYAQKNGKHLVASQMSLSEGINLSQYRVFIFGEENYVPGSNHQFVSRVVRDRNDNGTDREPVRVFYVQARKTLDEDIHRISKSRKTANQATRELLERTLQK